MVVLLCVGVVIVGVFAASLATWLVHVLKREGGIFIGREIDRELHRECPFCDTGEGAGRDDDLLPVERRQNAYLRNHHSDPLGR